jgi:hypothetical protein
MLRGPLRGFATVELACGLVLIDLPVFIGRDGPWTALPRKAVLDAERRQRFGADGKPMFEIIVQWRDRALSGQFSAAVIALVRRAHPGAFS